MKFIELVNVWSDRTKLKYKANWIKTEKGNGIKTGNTIIVKVVGAITVSGWIARKTWHGKKIMQIGQGKTLVSFKLKEKKRKKTGTLQNR